VSLGTIAAAWGAAALVFLVGYLVGYRFGVARAWRQRLPSQTRQAEHGPSAGGDDQQDPPH